MSTFVLLQLLVTTHEKMSFLFITTKPSRRASHNQLGHFYVGCSPSRVCMLLIEHSHPECKSVFLLAVILDLGKEVIISCDLNGHEASTHFQKHPQASNYTLDNYILLKIILRNPT